MVTNEARAARTSSPRGTAALSLHVRACFACTATWLRYASYGRAVDASWTTLRRSEGRDAMRSAKRAPRRLRGLSTSDLRLSRKDYPKTERRGVDSARLGRVRVEAGFFHACLDFVALRDRTCRTACSSARESHAAEARHGLHAPKTTLESRRAARAWLLPAKRTGFSAPRPLLMARFA